jgi:1-acylglycerone phosphate reductase
MKVVVITGCSNGGIGSALALKFSEEGCTVYAGARKQQALSNLAAKPRIKTFLLDVNNSADCLKTIQDIHKEEGRIDILVNNAGTPCPGSMYDQSMDHVRRVFETNVFSVMYLSNLVFPIMAKQESRGKILNIGSIAGDISVPWSGVYCSSKAAVGAMTDCMRQEFAPFGIEVCLVQPGAIISNIGNNGVAQLELPGPTSPFAPFKESILARAMISQSIKSTPTDLFAAKVVCSALSSSRLPIRLRYGHMSLMFWIFTTIPLSLVHFIFARNYGLNRTLM